MSAAQVFSRVASVAASVALGACFGDLSSLRSMNVEPARAARCEGEAPRVAWPLAGAVSRDWAVIAYMDHDPSPGTRDFMGQVGADAITYDGHDGIDIGLAGFEVMDRGVPVYAGVDGVVKDSQDGAPDRNTVDTPDEVKREANLFRPLAASGSRRSGGLAPHGRRVAADRLREANYVLVDAGHGYTVAYWHLRKGSVRVRPGDVVGRGQQLGEVGSSGISSGPHLHLSAYDCHGAALDQMALGLIDDAPPYDPPPGLLALRVVRQAASEVELYLLFASIRKGDRVSLTATRDGVAPIVLTAGNDTVRQIPNFYWRVTVALDTAARWTLTTRVNDSVVDERAWPMDADATRE